MMKQKMILSFYAICVCALLQACGGGGGGGGDGAAPAAPIATADSIVSGTAAFGEPMSGATITLTDANGTTKSTLAAADGTYAITVTGLNAPFLLVASGVSGDTVKTYSALLAEAPASGKVVNVNVTPLTDAIVALASSSGYSPGEFSTAATLKALNPVRLKKAEDTIKAIIAAVAADAGLPADFNPVTTPFVASLGLPGDKLLETVKVGITDAGVTLTNALAAVASGATSASATITVKDVTTVDPKTVTVLPKPTVTPTFNTLLALLRSQMNVCLALAPADRVTLDSSGEVTALKGDCTAAKLSAFEASYLNGGLDLVGRWGPRLRDLPKGASMAQAEVLGTFARDDGGTNLTVRLPLNASSGGTSYNESLRTDAAGVYRLSGNQRKYDLSISARLYRIFDVSSYDRIGGGDDAGKNVGKLSRLETSLFASFNLTPSAAKVYAVRVRGPGLPTAGLVLARSSVCGTGDALTIYSSDGSLPAVPAGTTTPFTATLQSAASWRMSAVPLTGDYKGTNLLKEVRGWTTTAGPSTTTSATNYAETTYDIATIPESAAYDWEVYSINAPGVAETFSTRLTDKPVGTDFAKTFAWTTATSAALDYLNPAVGNAKAAAVSDATLSWLTPSNAPLVVYAGLNGTARGANNDTLRFTFGETVAPVGATSMKVGASQETDAIGNACSLSSAPALSATTGSRAVQLEQRADRVKMIQRWEYSGRALTAPPVASTAGIGWNSYNADLAPLANASVLQADGLPGQFSLNGTPVIPTSIYASASGGFAKLDSTAVVSDSQYYRVSNVVNNAGVYPKTFTALARVSGNATTTARVIDLDMAFADAGLTGTKILLTVRENDGAKGVCIFNYDGTTAALCKEPLNTSVAHIYHVTVTLSSATSGVVRVYLDGNSTPIIDKTVATFRPTSTAGDNYLRFGDSSNAQAYVSAMDWMIWTHTGAYTPSELLGKLPSGLGVTSGY